MNKTLVVPSDSKNVPADYNAAQPLSLKDAFDIYQKQSDSVHRLWAYFQVVSVAVLAYTVGTEKTQWSTPTYFLIGLSYILFAGANQWVLLISQREMKAFEPTLHSLAGQHGNLGEPLKLRAVDPNKVRLFHTSYIAFVVCAVACTRFDHCNWKWSCPVPASEAAKK
jgi:hypothetical protein